MWLEVLINGLIYTVVGVAIVFLALVVIMFGIKLVTAVVTSMEGKGKEKPAAPAAPVPAPVVKEPVAVNGVSPEVVAAITAAITMIMSAETAAGATPVSFRVKKIKRI